MTSTTASTPRTIADYLEQLRNALRGADPALIQDALYDAEEHLRAELAEQPGRSEADMLARVVTSYGAPEEVAELYRDQEIKIQRALRPPPPPKRRSLLGRFVSVGADPRTYGSLFYMLLALATGIFFFVWAVVGMALSFGLAVLIIGIPFIVLFFGSIRVLSLVEGRIVEAMLGVRMPRRPNFSQKGVSLWRRIGAMFTDPRTWSTLFYMILKLPLGIFYFVFTVVFCSISLAFVAAPFAKIGALAMHIPLENSCDADQQWVCNVASWWSSWPGAIVMCLIGLVMVFTTLHIIRGMGRLHGNIAKHLLVAGILAE